MIRPTLVARLDSLRFGFRGGPKSADECGTRSGGNPIFSELPLIVSCKGSLARKDSGTSKPNYNGAAILAVMGITVLGDGIGKVKEGTTDEIRSA